MTNENPINRKIIFLILVFLGFAIQGSGQSHYQTSWEKDGIISGIGVVLLGASFYTSQLTEPLTPDEILLLDRNDLNSWDRQATFNFSSGAKTASDVLLYSSLALPLIPLIDKNMKAEKGKILLMYMETLFLNFGVTQLTKSISLRSRPLVYNEEFSLDDKTRRKARYSFFSGHVSTVASYSFLTAAIINQYYEGRKFVPYVWAAAAILPLATGYFRVQSGKHFPTDVVVGYAAGSLIGLMVHNIHKVKSIKDNGISFNAGINGFVLVKRF